jgi:glucose/arabinose dehydrogenase
LPSGFYGNEIASTIPLPRQLVALPNGDLLVGSKNTRGSYSPTGPCSGCSSSIYLVPGADGLLAAGTPVVFATVPDAEAQGVAFSSTSNMIYIASTFGVWSVPYHTGDQVASQAPTKIVSVRTGPIAVQSNGQPTDGDVHSTTSVAVSGSYLYIGVGSSCNRCTEQDPTRAVVLRTDLSGHNQVTVATRFRNAIALATNPRTGTLWAGGAGQDCLAVTASLYPGNPFPTSCGAQDNAYMAGHPYEFIDHVSTSAATSSNGIADYGWPVCEENRQSYVTPAVSCTNVIEPAVEAPAYSTIIGATFYPTGLTGAYAFPSKYAGGLFLSFHGSWHENSNGVPITPPNTAFVPMSGDSPITPVNWSAPASQWGAFLSGFQDNEGIRYGQPTGLAVGPQGSLFIADDFTNVIYRIRPGTPPAGAAHALRNIR